MERVPLLGKSARHSGIRSSRIGLRLGRRVAHARPKALSEPGSCRRVIPEPKSDVGRTRDVPEIKNSPNGFLNGFPARANVVLPFCDTPYEAGGSSADHDHDSGPERFLRLSPDKPHRYTNIFRLDPKLFLVNK